MPWGTVMMIMIVAEEISLEEKEVSTVELETLEEEKKGAILGEKSGMIGQFETFAEILELFSLSYLSYRGIMEPRRGESWSQRGSRSQPRHEYRESYRGRERYSPAGGYDAPQAPKRMRPDWYVVSINIMIVYLVILLN